MDTLLPSVVPLDTTARLEMLGYLRGRMSCDDAEPGRELYLQAYGFAADAQQVREVRNNLGGA